MTGSTFPNRLENARGLPDIFELVKESVLVRTGMSRGGLMLGLTDLGCSPDKWVGGLYPVATNVIVMNKRAMRLIESIRPDMYKSYLFHILLHEYIHALGTMDEAETRQKAYSITKALFGEGHMATIIAKDISVVLPYAAYPVPTEMSGDMQVELVKGFDRSSTDQYIY
ncbi:MAG TPA: hypothetical protein VLH13_05370 [Methanomassiliicoccales archaeon]|nr:hypothetical protein [Methanomassiliicoccales archaeon]